MAPRTCVGAKSCYSGLCDKPSAAELANALDS